MNRYRRDVATMLFDKNNLMPQMDVAENIAMPLRVHGTARGKAIERALEILDSVGLPRSFAALSPAMLSGGDQQRVAIARALAADSQILLAAEPTRNLDVENAAGVAQLLVAFARREGRCAVIGNERSDAGEIRRRANRAGGRPREAGIKNQKSVPLREMRRGVSLSKKSPGEFERAAALSFSIIFSDMCGENAGFPKEQTLAFAVGNPSPPRLRSETPQRFRRRVPNHRKTSVFRWFGAPSRNA